jgi:hypothetical protein
MPIIINDPLRGRPREASRIPAPTSAVLMEQFATTYEENPIAASARWFELEQQKARGPRLDAATAREQLKSAGLDGDLTVDDNGITQEALDTLMWRKKVERRRQDIASRAEGGLAQGAARLGVAAATTLADPVSAALNFVPVVGQARYARWLNSARGVGARIGVRAGVGAAEGAAGAAIVEPLIYASRTAEQADYTAVDSLMNVAFGGLIGTAMHTTVGTLGDVLARPRSQAPVTTATPQRTRIEPTFDAAGDSAAAIARAMKPEDFQATVREAVAQAVEGRPIDVEAAVARADVKQTELPSFKQWFGDSKVVDEAGQPLRLYHGTAAEEDFVEFSLEKFGRSDAGARGRGLYFTTKADEAGRIAEDRAISSDAGARVMPVYVRARNPAIWNEELQTIRREMTAADFTNHLESRGFDSVMYRRPDGSAEWVAFRPEQIKSATGNSGRFDARSSSLTDPIEAERAGLDAYAEETIASDARATDDTEDLLAEVRDEETFATQQLKELYDRLGREVKSAEYDEVIEAATNAERWAKTADLATVCLTRGG